MDLRPGTSLVIGFEHLESPSFGFLESHSTPSCSMIPARSSNALMSSSVDVAAVLGGSKRDIVPSMSRFEGEICARSAWKHRPSRPPGSYPMQRRTLPTGSPFPLPAHPDHADINMTQGVREQSADGGSA